MNGHLTPDRREELRRLAEAATKGPPPPMPDPLVVPCPHCEGTGNTMAFVDGIDPKTGKRWGRCGQTPCGTCGGEKRVSAVRLAAMEEGKRLRRDRIARGLSLKDEAARLGISMRELSAREHGREYREDA